MQKDKSNVEAITKSNEIFKMPHYILDKVKKIHSKKLYIDPRDIEAFKNSNVDKHKPIRVSRSTEISAEFVGRKVEIHNGKDHITRIVEIDMVGRKFGEFSETRKPVKFPAKKGLADMKKKKKAGK